MAAQTDIALRAILANAGVEAAYRKGLQKLARAMAVDVLKSIGRVYRPAASRVGMDMAMDDDPVVELRTLLRRLSRRWIKRFDAMSKDIAEMFAKESGAHLDMAFRKRLKEAGFTVRFRPTDRMISAYRSVVAENINLIKSIPQQFLRDVESAVWTNVMKGSAMYELSKEIRAKYGVTYRRAAFISRDQTNKARAVMEEARRSELGIEEAEWRHSHAGKYPRPTHLAMHGKRYKIKDGMYDSAVGRNVWPGTEIGCRCSSRAILPLRLAKAV